VPGGRLRSLTLLMSCTWLDNPADELCCEKRGCKIHFPDKPTPHVRYRAGAEMMAKKSIDRRAARSRAKLHEALLCLMAQRSYETITVEDICDRASVSRSTFYSHYAGKDDLIRNWLRQLRELVVYQATDQAMPGCPRGGFAFSLTMLEHA